MGDNAIEIFHNLDELIKAHDCDSFEEYERAMYKYTDCGMPVSYDADRDAITLTGYVENDSDYSGVSETLYFPFSKVSYDEAVERLELIANYQWKWFHEDIDSLMTKEEIEAMIGDDEEAEREYRWTMAMNY